MTSINFQPITNMLANNLCISKKRITFAQNIQQCAICNL